jgi:hypothetical protein
MGATTLAKTKAPVERLPLKILIGEDEIDLNPVLPFKISTWRKLKAKGVDPIILARMAQRQELDSTPLIDITVAAIQLARPGLTVEQIEDSIEFADVNRIALAVLGAESGDAVDRPTSTGSSPSPSDGAGDPEKLAA